jgi:hypothetical protein
MDEWREIENRNPIPGGAGKKHYVQLNLTPVDEKREMAPMAPGFGGAMGVWVMDVAGRIASARYRDVESHLGWAMKNHKRFEAWLEVYAATHKSYILKLAGPIALALSKSPGWDAAGEDLLSLADSLVDLDFEKIRAADPGDIVCVLGRLCEPSAIAEKIKTFFKEYNHAVSE